MLSAPDAPGNAVENRCSPAPDVQAANFQDCFRLALHAANIFVKTPQEAKQMSNGAWALARFTVRSERTLEMPCPVSFRTLKRRERRAPNSTQSRYSFVRELQ